MKAFSLHLVILFVFIEIWINVNAKDASTNNKNLKITNGAEAKPHSFPYMVAIRTNIDDRDVLCGGSLITDSLVLTAARCLYGATEAEVTLGAHNLEEEESTQMQLTSTSFVIHEDYRNDSMQHDIAVLQLPNAVPLGDAISTVRLPEVIDIFTNYDEKLGVTAGWGKTNDSANSNSNVLRYANLTIIPNLICGISHAFQISLEQMCTSGVSQKNICLGDSGGPLIVDGVQVGIASFGSDFGCMAGFPGVYTRLTAYLSWLGTSLQ